MKIVLLNTHNRTVCCPDGTQLRSGQSMTVEMSKEQYGDCKDFPFIEVREIRASPTRPKRSKDKTVSKKADNS